MPIFEYSCKDCGAKFEKIVFKRDAPPPPCPECGSEQVEKLVSAPSVGGGSSAGWSSGASSSSCSSSSGFS